MRYAVVIEKGKGNYSAYVSDLPGCIATGADRTRTAAEAQLAAINQLPAALLRTFNGVL